MPVLAVLKEQNAPAIQKKQKSSLASSSLPLMILIWPQNTSHPLFTSYRFADLPIPLPDCIEVEETVQLRPSYKWGKGAGYPLELVDIRFGSNPLPFCSCRRLLLRGLLVALCHQFQSPAHNCAWGRKAVLRPSIRNGSTVEAAAAAVLLEDR